MHGRASIIECFFAMESRNYSSFQAAWASVAGSLPAPPDLMAPPGSWWVTVDESQAGAAGSGEAGALLRLTVDGSANRIIRRAIIRAGNTPAGLPAVEDAPSVLAEGAVFAVLVQGEVKGRASTRAGFDLQWFRETAAGKFTGDFGVALEAVVEMALEVAFSGEFLAALSREGELMRLRLFRRTDANWLSRGIRIAADARGTLPEKPEDLVRALLGVHDEQWLQALTGDYGAAIAAKLRVAQATLARALDFWRGLDTGVAAVVWKALGDRAATAQVREWLAKIAAAADRAAFTAVLKEAIECVPGFTQSAVARCIEAIAGSLLAVVTTEDAWVKVRHTAARADGFLSEPGVARALARLRDYAAKELGIDKVEAALSKPVADIDEWLRAKLTEALGSSSAAAAVGAALGVARRVYSEAAAAVAKKLTAELNWRAGRSWRNEALVDCAFAPAGEGMDLYRRALAGEAGALFEAAAAGKVHAREAVLTHGIGGETRLELRLPFFNRSEWSSRWESLATARIEAGEGGRVVVYSVEAADRFAKKNLYQSALAITGAIPRAALAASLTITYSDTRTLKRDEARFQLEPLIAAYRFPTCAIDWLAAAEGEVEAALTLSVPGDLASAWLRAPRERDADYFRNYAAMSVAVQRALRVWLPYVYFSEVRRYEDLGAAWPLLVYKCTRPFPGRPPGEFTYDIMDIGSMRVARQTVVRALALEMRRAGYVLAAAGRTRAASFYREMQPAAVIKTVEHQPANFNALVSADSLFVDALVELGGRGRELSDDMANEPERAVRRLAAFAANFAKTFHGRLRRLYGGQRFPAFGALLLAEATNALACAVGPPAKLAGVLRLKSRGTEQVFTNDGFSP